MTPASGPYHRQESLGTKQRRFRGRLARYRAMRGGNIPRRRIPPIAVPSFFTLMNLFSGYLAIVQVYDGRFVYAGWLIVLAAVFDVFDGMMARLTKTNSPFGVELDSLSDVVSFGVAPSFLVFAFALKESGPLGLVVSAMPAICGAVRLARFNTKFGGDEKKDHFVGMPIPGQAIILVACILNFDNAAWLAPFGERTQLSMLTSIVVLLSFLMVSNIPFEAIPKPSPAYIRAHPVKFAAYSVAFLAVIFFHHVGLFASLAVYLVYNIVRAITKVFRDVANTPLEDELEGQAPAPPDRPEPALEPRRPDSPDY